MKIKILAIMETILRVSKRFVYLGSWKSADY